MSDNKTSLLYNLQNFLSFGIYDRLNLYKEVYGRDQDLIQSLNDKIEVMEKDRKDAKRERTYWEDRFTVDRDKRIGELRVRLVSMEQIHSEENKQRDETEAHLRNEIVNFKAHIVEMHGAMLLIEKENEEIKEGI